jgi:putative PEP-CTERM system TPR-repeat lipoprotein
LYRNLQDLNNLGAGDVFGPLRGFEEGIVSGRKGFPKSRRRALMTLWLLSAAIGVYGQGSAVEAAVPVPVPVTEAGSPMSSDTKKLLEDAQSAQSRGELGLAVIQLKNAVRLAPRNGEVRARLGMALLKAGDTRTAQRELRQAWKDNAPEELVIPPIVDSMVVRGEARELLEEFADPSPGTQTKVAADILRARALALQIIGRSADAKAAMARSLNLRRDTRALLASAKLATQQGDVVLARSMVDEAAKLSPTNEDVLVSQVALVFQSGDARKTLAAADEFIRRTPNSTVGRVMRVEALLALKQDAIARDEIDALELRVPDSSFIPYYRGVLFARANDFKNAWHEVQTLHPEFVLSQPTMAMLVAEIAIASGNVESGAAILGTLVSRRPTYAPARVRLASVQLTLKSPSAALKTLEPIKTNNDPEMQAILGQANLQLGRFSDAIGALEKAIGSGARDDDGLKLQLAQSAYELGDTDRAIKTLEEVRSRDPNNWETAIPLVSSLVQSGKPDEALDVVDRMAKNADRSPVVPFYRARVLAAAGNLADASAAFTQALAIDPKFVPALYFRALVLVAQGNPEAGKKDLRQVLALDPANAYAYIALAQIALHEGQGAQSIALLSNAVKVAPRNPSPRLALATYQASQRKFQDARATLNALLQISPNDPITLAQIGRTQFMAGQVSDAVDTFRSLAATYTTSAGTYVLLAKALNATKDRLAAIDAARRAVELDPYSPEIRSLLVEYLIIGGRPDEALANAREYNSAHPGPDSDLLLVSALIALKRVDEAKTFLTSRLAAKPDRLLALRLSQLAMDTGDRKKAVDVLVEWLRKKPTDYDVRRQYGALLLQIGDAPGARKEFEPLLKQRPEDPVVLNNLSWILRDEDPERAFSLVSLASKIVPESTQVMDTLAWMKFQRRDVQGALVLLRRAYTLDANDAEIGYHYAVALDATGRRSEAKTLLQSVVEKSPEFSDRDKAKQLLSRW